jgi:hypothetical protein
VHQLLIDFKKAYDSFRREVLCNILIEFGFSMKVVRLIKMCLNERYNRVWVGKHLSDMFLAKNDLKQEDALSPLLFRFAFECAVRRVQVNQEALNLNGTHQSIVYADDANMLGRSIHAINTAVLVVASQDIGLEVNAEKTKCIVMSRDQNAEQNHSIKIDNESFERVEQFRYLGTTHLNQNSIQEETESRLKSWIACCHVVQSLLSSSVLSKIIKIKIHRVRKRLYPFFYFFF